MILKLNAYITDYALRTLSRDDLTAEKLAHHIILSQFDMTEYGNVKVGEVEVDFEVLPEDQIVGNAIIALRAKAAGIRAKATAEATAIEGRVQQLLSIENKLTKED